MYDSCKFFLTGSHTHALETPGKIAVAREGNRIPSLWTRIPWFRGNAWDFARSAEFFFKNCFI